MLILILSKVCQVIKGIKTKKAKVYRAKKKILTMPTMKVIATVEGDTGYKETAKEQFNVDDGERFETYDNRKSKDTSETEGLNGHKDESGGGKAKDEEDSFNACKTSNFDINVVVEKKWWEKR